MSIKNTAEMRSYLLERMEGLASGRETVAQCQAAASLAKQVNATLSLELQAVRLVAQSAANLKPLSIAG